MPAQLPVCPQCDARLTPSADGEGLWCQFCGTRRDDAEAQQALAAYRARAPHEKHYQPPVRDFEMDDARRRALSLAWDCIQEGDLKTARFVLQTAVSQHASFADAWYLLSLTTGDRGEKLIYLRCALEAQPYHEYAWRDKGVLEGVIPDGPAPAQPDTSDPVVARAQTPSCPLCGGALAFDVNAGDLVCHHCGFQPGDRPAMDYRTGYERLENALLQRRFGFSREWQIGERVLVCPNCHAQHTLSGSTLSAQCWFCDSAHVLVRDVVGSFEEPDALLPFQIDRSAAAWAVHERMLPELRTRVVRGEIQGVYVPLWAFEAVVAINPASGVMSFEPVPVGVYTGRDVLVSGSRQPKEAILYELMPYDLSALVPYDRRYLARWPAQLYQIDVVQASITARAYLKYAARQHVLGYPVPDVELARSDTHGYNPPDTPLWRASRVEIDGLNYRLLLLPVWLVTLYLDDGTRRPAVVNGQTGEALISASFIRPESIIAGPQRATRQDMLPIPGRLRSQNR